MAATPAVKGKGGPMGTFDELKNWPCPVAESVMDTLGVALVACVTSTDVSGGGGQAGGGGVGAGRSTIVELSKQFTLNAMRTCVAPVGMAAVLCVGVSVTVCRMLGVGVAESVKKRTLALTLSRLTVMKFGTDRSTSLSCGSGQSMGAGLGGRTMTVPTVHVFLAETRAVVATSGMGTVLGPGDSDR